MPAIAKQWQGNEQNQEIQVDKTAPQIILSAQTIQMFKNIANAKI